MRDREQLRGLERSWAQSGGVWYIWEEIACIGSSWVDLGGVGAVDAIVCVRDRKELDAVRWTRWIREHSVYVIDKEDLGG